jgi:hypothetical protein
MIKRRGPCLEERFWPRVNKDTLNGCWIWLGASAPSGHGRIGNHNKVYQTHRVSWELEYGSIPAGLCVLHKCDNPRCVNPEHLFLGTQIENLKDMDQKKRRRVGVGIRNANAKLNNESVMEIREKYSSGSFTKTALSEKYGVSQSTIRQVVERKTWRL